MIYKNFSFPKRFAHLLPGELNQLKTKVVTVNPGGDLISQVYDTLDKALAEHNLHEFAGPFGDGISNELCIRFESSAACDILSN